MSPEDIPDEVKTEARFHARFYKRPIHIYSIVRKYGSNGYACSLIYDQPPPWDWAGTVYPINEESLR